MNVGHVYVLGFSNGTVKVGQTQNGPQRMSAHKSDAGKFGLEITEEWISPAHIGFLANERALKAIAAGLGGTPTRPEYFSGVSFAAIVEVARELPFTPPPEVNEQTPGGGGMSTEAVVDADIWEIIRCGEALFPDLTLSDMLQAFTDALKRREGEFASCATCRKAPGTGCAQHAEDRRLARAYRELRQTFAGACVGGNDFMRITQAILRGPGKAPVYSGTPLRDGKVLVRRDVA